MSNALPRHAVGKFPFNRPTPLLRDQMLAIEAMLAPLSDKRARAAELSRQTLKPRSKP